MSASNYIRQAAMAALKDGDDSAALALIALLDDSGPAPEAAPEPVPRNRSFWVRVISERYIPSLFHAGKKHFRTKELLIWIEAHPGIELNAADRGRCESGHVVWTRRVSLALAYLREIGAITAPYKCREYTYDPLKLRFVDLEVPANYPIPD